MPTCLDLSGAKYPDKIPNTVGKSLVHSLQGSQQQVHEEAIYWEHEGNAAVRWGKWKLVREYKKPWELFDIEKDRTEMHNLVDIETAKRDELIGMWESWATARDVAYPKAFNMYQFLNAKKKKQREAERAVKTSK